MILHKSGHRRPFPSLALAGLAASAILLSGCSAATESSASADQVIIVMPEEPTSLDACDSLNSSRSRVLRGNVVEALTSRNIDTGEIEPMLATSWSSSDSLTWTFTLREGVTFQDEAKFDAAAVVTSMDRLFDKDLACDNANDLFNPPTPTSVEATGDLEVTIALDQPDPIFPLRMSFVHISSPNTPTDNKGTPAIGTGPYTITDWSHGESIQLDQYKDYWGDKPSIPSAEFLFRAESPVRAAMVETGEADLAYNVAAQDVKPGTATQSFENGEVTYFRIDAEVAPLNDVRLREALNLATDRQAIIDSAFGGYATLASEIFVPSTLGYNDSLPDWKFDPEKAATLVKEAAADGVDTSSEIVLYGRPDFYPNAREVTEILAAQWQAIGLNIRIENVEGGPWGEILLRPHADGRQPNILQSSHGNTTGDASFTVVNKYTCAGSQSASCSPEFDALVNEALTTADLTERAKLFSDAMEIERNDVIQDINLAYMQGIIQTSSRISYTATRQTDFELLLKDMSLN